MSAESFFTDDDIADLREMEESALTDLADVYEPPTSEAANKGEDAPSVVYPDDYTVIASQEPCRYDAMTGTTGREAVLAGKPSAEADGIVSFRHHFPIKNNHKIRITTLGNMDLEVIRIRAVSDEIVRQVEVKQIG